jgi:CSLREA domain-containing protein
MQTWFTRNRLAPRRRSARHPLRWPLHLEQLEGRLAPAVLLVTTTADDITPNDGSVSLREAITAINAGNSLGDPDIIAQNPGTFGTSDTIKFNIPGAAPFQINVGSSASAANIALPQIIQPVVIDGTSQPGYSGHPVIIVNGASAGANANGLDIELGTNVFSAGVTVQGLVINQFSGNGIEIGADNVTSVVTSTNNIGRNYIGTDVTGNTAVGNGASGIFINGVDSDNLGIAASNNVIANNVISGNANDGVLIQANANGVASGNTVVENSIGANVTGTAPVPNGASGNLSATGSSGVEIIGA